jgi:membrane fusion protein (multidrug efflux system)
VQGVAVSNQVAGQVKEIRFDSGARVTQGQVLVHLDDDVDQADLEGLRAAERLATIKLQRNSTLLKDKAVSQGDFDEVSAQLDQARAQVKSKQATIDKKVIRAPFDGQLGIRQIDLGQFLPEGTPIVLLQALDPIYVDYALPEREINHLEVGQAVRVRVAAHPDDAFEGTIAALTPGVEKGTRSVQVRARFANPGTRLRPGMFARVETLLPMQERVLTLPREAIAFNTYGDSVFLVEEGNGKLQVQRRQIETGAVRGDEVAVRSGLAAGDRVVSAGQVKLINGQEIQIKGANPDAAATEGGAGGGATP